MTSEKNTQTATAAGEMALTMALKAPGVRVDRESFLINLTSKRVTSPEDQERLLTDGPGAFYTEAELLEMGRKAVLRINAQSSGIAVLTGLPGGPIGIASGITVDTAQMLAYSIRLAQELAFIWGYSIFDDEDGEELDAADIEKLLLFVGAMFSVDGAAAGIRISSRALANQAARKLPRAALTRFAFYRITKKVLAVFGVKVTRGSFAKGVSKAIPVLGGVISGGLNYAAMRAGGHKLNAELAKGFSYTAHEQQEDIEVLEGIVVSEGLVENSQTSNDEE